MQSPACLRRWAAGAGAVVLAAGFAVSATAMAPATTEDPVSAIKVVDADGVEHELSAQEVSQELNIDLGAIAGMLGPQNGPRARGGGDGLASWKDVSNGFEKVTSTAEGRSLYGVWVNNETNQMLAELPRGFQNQKHFFAMTVAGGEIFAGLQAGDIYVYWKQYGKNRVALVAPQISVRSSGDQESKDSVKMIFTDRVLLDVPVLAKGPNGQPVIDLDGLLVGRAGQFFGGSARGLRGNLAEIDSAKAFPENIEIAYKVPDASGTIKTYHYSISLIKGTPGFQPRKADTRVGYFTTSYRDLGKFTREDVDVNYINRWHIQKAEPNRRLSPPKEPLVYYVEHTVPVRYRRWVRAGIEYWNEAFREIGIDGAIEVRYQDKATGAHMDKDPEDVRYNFIRWLSNDVSTAIGPEPGEPDDR